MIVATMVDRNPLRFERGDWYLNSRRLSLIDPCKRLPMTLFYYDPVFLDHQTGDHPERPDRIVPAVRHLDSVASDSLSRCPDWESVSMERLLSVHDRAYIESVEVFARAGGGKLDADTVVSERSYDVARRATGAVCDAVERVVRGEDKTAFCLSRPPGHHAMPDHAMGFCLFNHIAVAARVATNELGIERVLIVDFDVHHGNGTQAMFEEVSDVAYFSMHRSPFYPDTGGADEIGRGRGLGMTRNVPIAFGTPRDEVLSKYAEQVTAFADSFQPQLLLVSAGFDAHKNDPIGSLGLESEDFRPITRVLVDIATKHTGGRLVSMLEGGYNAEAVADSIAIHLEELAR